MKHATAALFLGITLGLSALVTGTAHAEDKFAQMDTNKDGKITWEEFHTFYPQMQQAAFDSIDANKDKSLSREEWEAFMTQHSMGRANTPQGMGGSMGGAMPPKAMPNSPKCDDAPTMMISPPPAQK
ncbi:MAG: EF-hand domain-containing protein [Desulfovibrionaceae bacterium]